MDKRKTAFHQVEFATGSRDAYWIGSCIQRTKGWADSLKEFKDGKPPAPSKWEFPFTAFNYPLGRFGDRIASSLRRFALLRTVDPVLVSEMHRSCDDLKKSIATLARDFNRGKRKHRRIGRSYPRFQRFFAHITKVADELFIEQSDAMRDWYRLGELLGEALCLHTFESGRANLPRVMTEFINLGRKLLPENTIDEVIKLHDPDACYVGIAKREEPSGELIVAILELDKWIERNLKNSVSKKPYLVFDDSNATISYFDTKISFDDFKTGGVSLLRVFVHHPSVAIRADDLFKEAINVGANEFQAPQYLTRLRKVIRKKIGAKQLPSELSAEHATKCFIISDGKARSQSNTKGTFYKLALPPERVRYIAS